MGYEECMFCINVNICTHEQQEYFAEVDCPFYLPVKEPKEKKDV